jgi:hypothetical protein
LFFSSLLTWIIFTDTVQQITYSDLSGELRGFPRDIPRDVEKIEIKKPKIPTIDYIEPFASLRIFIFTTNALEEFTDFSNINAVIKGLRLTNNKIHQVQFIPQQPYFASFDLSGNDLTKIPSFSL